jgi:hypothetical protein
MAKLGRMLLVALWSVAVLGALARVSRDTYAWARRDYLAITTPALAEFRTEILGVMTLGHRNIWDDYAHIRTLQFLADPATQAVGGEVLSRAVMVVARHKPRIDTFYMLACFILLDMRRPELCEPLMIEGIAARPESWRLPLTQGFVSAFKMHDRAKAATYYALAASRPGAPPYIESVSRKLASEAGLDEADLKGTVQQMLEFESERGGSRFDDFLKGMNQRREQ